MASKAIRRAYVGQNVCAMQTSFDCDSPAAAALAAPPPAVAPPAAACLPRHILKTRLQSWANTPVRR